jgi:hypothetical protein
MLQRTSTSIHTCHTGLIEADDHYVHAGDVDGRLIQKLHAKGFDTQSANHLLRYDQNLYWSEQSELVRFRIVRPVDVLYQGQLDFGDRCMRLGLGYDLFEFHEAALARGCRELPPSAVAAIPWQDFDHQEGEPTLLLIGIRPVPAGSGGFEVLSLSRNKNGSDWVSSFRWHPNIASFLSILTPWVYGW